jgi:hypothetical protein
MPTAKSTKKPAAVAQWRVAKSILKLREQINQFSPNRSKVSDGTIGDARHATTASDHNPWVKIKENGKTMGIVTALDITDDVPHGVNAYRIALQLAANKDKRIKYIISNGAISNPSVQGGAWRPYKRPNGHYHHFHVSVHPDQKRFDDTSDWKLDFTDVPAKAPQTPKHEDPPVLALGAKGAAVGVLQKRLGFTGDQVDEIFGPKTDKAVRAFQKAAGLTVDGVVGVYTWNAFPMT